MQTNRKWRALGSKHELWELVRFYRALRGSGKEWLRSLAESNAIFAGTPAAFPIDPAHVKLLQEYLAESAADLEQAFMHLREESEALAFCDGLGATVRRTKTKSKDHHQSSKSMVAAVGAIAERVCEAQGIDVDPDPQRRAIWCADSGLHVTARNLDGAIPSLMNPAIIWEIKEYWGKTNGGSKMSDAVYECQLVGRELRDFEERSGVVVSHIVFLDGRDQWGSRRSDMQRFIDLFHQGLIDHLIVGKEVEREWEGLLLEKLSAA